MGNSTKSLQEVADFAKTCGDLQLSPPVGGYTNKLSLELANDVMTAMIAERFNWKFNRFIIPPFLTNSWQQDYASIAQKNIGWLEHGVVIDINNTALPKPLWQIEVVRDLERTSTQYGRPTKACWLPNDQLFQDVWPGAQKTYTNPLGAVAQPANPPMNITDANGNILVLTTFGVTGNSAPVLAASSASGTTVADGTCVWTVADPKGQGIRLRELPSQTGVVYQIYLAAQARLVKFTAMSQLLDPVPDDYAKYFQDGFIALAHRHSASPAVQNKFEKRHAEWLQSLATARGQGDRERDDARFEPERGIMDDAGGMAIGPAWPWGPR